MKILAIVVRYQMPLTESPTVRGLCDSLSLHTDLQKNYIVAIWDNSPEPVTDPQLPIPFIYRHSTANLGVSGAYNDAMSYALEHGYPWMLLLDQDTKITHEFLSGMLWHGMQLQTRREIAAITPTIRCGEIVISPSRRSFARVRAYSAVRSGIALGEATAINSGSLMRVQSLKQIGGFSSDFWLDYSDEYVFHQFYIQGMKIWLASDVEIQHDLSIMDYDHSMSPSRYRNFVEAETAFLDLYRSRAERMVLTLRLFARSIKHRMKYGNPEYSRIAREHFRLRLLMPRTKRIAKWLADGERRLSRQVF